MPHLCGLWALRCTLRLRVVKYGYLFSVVIANAVGLVVDVIATAQAAVKSGCAEGDFLD